MFRLLLKVSTSRKALLLFGLFIVLELVFAFVLIPPFMEAVGRPIPDMSPDLGYMEYRALIGAMEAGPGLGAYRAIEALDAIFPFVYALALAAVIGTCLRALELQHGRWKYLLLLPVLSAAADYAENVLIAIMIARHPGEYSGIAAATAIVTWTKFPLFALCIGASLILGSIAVLDRYRPKAIQTVLAPAPIGPYSQAVKVGRFVFVSGQLGMDPETGALAEGAAAQAERALDNIEAILEAESSSMAGIVKTTIFLKDMDDFKAVNEAYAKRFSGVMPARSTVQVAALPKGGLVEIEAIARFR
jgi:2-iminobutanoate/2-iminopropanoate deaminase